MFFWLLCRLFLVLTAKTGVCRKTGFATTRTACALCQTCVAKRQQALLVLVGFAFHEVIYPSLFNVF